jgi:hypothetical protein
MTTPFFTKINLAIERIHFRWPVQILPPLNLDLRVGQRLIDELNHREQVARLGNKELADALISEVWGEFGFGTRRDALIGEAVERLMPNTKTKA